METKPDILEGNQIFWKEIKTKYTCREETKSFSRKTNILEGKLKQNF